MAQVSLFMQAFLGAVRQRTEGDTYGTRALHNITDLTARRVEEWETAGKPADERPLVAEVVEACRASFFEVDRMLQDARRGAPGWAEAEQDLLAARETLWPLLDNFPPSHT